MTAAVEQSAPTCSPEISAGPRSPIALLDAAFDLYRAHSVTIMLTTAITFLPVQVAAYLVSAAWYHPLQASISGYLGPPSPSQAVLLVVLGLLAGKPESGVPGALSLVGLAAASAAVSVTVADISLGRVPSVRRAYQVSAPSLVRMLLATLLGGAALLAVVFTILVGTVMVAGLLSSASLAVGPAAVTALMVCSGILAYVLCAGVVAAYLVFLPQLVVLERLPISRLWERNRSLASGHNLRRAWVSVACVPPVVFGVQTLILICGLSQIGSIGLPPLLSLLAAALFSSLAVLTIQPYAMVFGALLYFDHRMRREGLDIRVRWDIIHGCGGWQKTSPRDEIAR